MPEEQMVRLNRVLRMLGGDHSQRFLHGASVPRGQFESMLRQGTVTDLRGSQIRSA